MSLSVMRETAREQAGARLHQPCQHRALGPSPALRYRAGREGRLCLAPGWAGRVLGGERLQPGAANA